MKIEMTGIYVSDVKKAFKFYTEILGFKQKMYIPKANLAIVVSPENQNGTSLLLEPNENPIASTYQKALFEANIPAITLSSSHIYEEHKQLEKRGVHFRKAPEKTDWGIEAVFEDTCGNLVQLAAIN